MKTFSLKFSAVICAFILLFTAFSSSSCKKDKVCHGKVHVQDSNNVAVSDALVKLSAASVNGDIAYDGTTDSDGDVSFDVKLPAIFDVIATKPSMPGKVGKGVLRVDEPGKTGTATVTIK